MPFYADFGEAIFNHPRLANSDVFASQTSRAHMRADGRFVVGRFRGCPGQEQQRCISTLMRLVSIKCRNKCSRPFQLNATRVRGPES